MTQVEVVSETTAKDPALDGGSERTDNRLAVESLFYALFRVVEVAEYAGSDEAVKWARDALGDSQLLHGFVERVREVRSGEKPDAASRFAAGSRSR
jgi:hypothetical protein